MVIESLEPEFLILTMSQLYFLDILAAAQRPDQREAFHKRLNLLERFGHPVRAEHRNETDVLRLHDLPSLPREQPIQITGRKGFLFVGDVISGRSLDDFQERVVSVRFYDNDRLRQPADVFNSFFHLVEMVKDASQDGDLITRGPSLPPGYGTTGMRGGQLFKKTVVRMPGPLWMEKRWLCVIRPTMAPSNVRRHDPASPCSGRRSSRKSPRR